MDEVAEDEAGGTGAALAGPFRFARWACARCGCGSGVVVLARGSGGENVRDAALEHYRLAGHGVVFTRGTMENIGGGT